MASQFATWIYWHETVMTNVQHYVDLRRMSHLNTMKSFQTWAFFTRSRTRMRRRIAGLCRAFENMILARDRCGNTGCSRFSINGIHQLETHAASLWGRGLRTLRRSFDSFVQYKDSMVKARQIFSVFKLILINAVNALMQRWRNTTLASVMRMQWTRLQHE